MSTRSMLVTSSTTRVMMSPVRRVSNHRSGKRWIFRVKIRADIENHLLLKGVVDENPQ